MIASCHRREQRAGRLGEWPTSRELLEEDVVMVVGEGASCADAARRCGVAEETVRRILRRVRSAGE
ncbi:hypothetical protein GCM10009800_38040 [Nocardiopsis rhodophaea]